VLGSGEIMVILSRRHFVVLVTVLLLLTISWSLKKYLDELPWRNSIDYSRQKVGVTFEKITGVSLPPDVKNAKSAGRSYLWKHWVWMRFEVTEATIKDLTSGRKRLGAEKTKQLLQESKMIASNNRYNISDLQHVRWTEIEQIQQPEAYEYTPLNQEPSFIWLTYLVLDRQRHIVYLWAFAD
jgi:hypothetical protein